MAKGAAHIRHMFERVLGRILGHSRMERMPQKIEAKSAMERMDQSYGLTHIDDRSRPLFLWNEKEWA